MTSAGPYEAEIAKLAEKLAENPTSRIFAPLADAYRRAGRIPEALQVCRSGLEHHPDYLSGLLVLARSQHDAGELDAAEATFRRIVERDPKNAAAERSLGEIAHAAGRDDEALERYRRAATLEPANAELRERLLAFETERAARAPAPLEEPPEPRRAAEGEEIATATLAEVYAEQGLHERALAIYRRLLIEDPANERVQRRIERLEWQLRAALPAMPGELRATGDEIVTAGSIEAPVAMGGGGFEAAPIGTAEGGFPETGPQAASAPWAFLLEDEVDHDPDQVFAGRGASRAAEAYSPASATTPEPRGEPPPASATTAEAQGEPPPAAAAEAPALPEDDLKKFQEWLKSLR